MKLALSNRSLARWILCASLGASSLASVMTFAPIAAADEPSAQDIAQARQLGGQAQAAVEAGNFAEAEKLWQAAVKLYPVAPTLTLGLARTQTKLGHYVAAQEGYNKIIREWSTHPSPPPAFKDALDAARTEVGPLSAKIASVVITVEGTSNPQVTIDGENVPSVALGLKRPVDPGSHTVKASAANFKPAETTFQVTEGGSAEAKIKLEPAPQAATPAATPATNGNGQVVNPNGPRSGDANADAGKGGSSNKTLAIVALSVGGVGLVVGSIAGLIALGKHSDLDNKCPDGKCENKLTAEVNSYNRMGTFSTVGFIVGGVGIAAGAVLWMTAPKGTASAPATTRTAQGFSVTPYVGLGGGGVTGRF